jgi:hypothetical protein
VGARSKVRNSQQNKTEKHEKEIGDLDPDLFGFRELIVYGREYSIRIRPLKFKNYT